MIAYILYKLLNLDANIWLFLFFSILPDASWPFYKNHRRESWYHTVLIFSWVVFFPPYWIAVASHFIADFFFGGIRLTPWSKRIGNVMDRETAPLNMPLVKRLLTQMKDIHYAEWYNILIEVVLIIIERLCYYVFFSFSQT